MYGCKNINISMLSVCVYVLMCVYMSMRELLCLDMINWVWIWLWFCVWVSWIGINEWMLKLENIYVYGSMYR